MRLFVKESIQIVPIGLEEAWDFFSSPANLSVITPEYMNFKITSTPEPRMYPGQIISYIVHPLFGIPMRWVTEISQVKEKEFFVDEQRSGPYSFWHHKHFFREVNNGTEIRDLVHYAIPAGFLSPLINAVLVKAKIEDIFEYRRLKIIELWGLPKTISQD